jgi:hypothetical protein
MTDGGKSRENLTPLSSVLEKLTVLPASQEIYLILCNMQVNYRVHTGLWPEPDESSPPPPNQDFSSNLFVQTTSEVHAASYSVGTEGPSPGVNRGRSVTLTSHPI